MIVCEDGGSSFAAVLFYGNELTLLMFEVLIFGLVDLASHNYFLGAAITFFIMEVCGLYWLISNSVPFFFSDFILLKCYIFLY